MSCILHIYFACILSFPSSCVSVNGLCVIKIVIIAFFCVFLPLFRTHFIHETCLHCITFSIVFLNSLIFVSASSGRRHRKAASWSCSKHRCASVDRWCFRWFRELHRQLLSFPFVRLLRLWWRRERCEKKQQRDELRKIDFIHHHLVYVCDGEDTWKLNCTSEISFWLSSYPWKFS